MNTHEFVEVVEVSGIYTVYTYGSFVDPNKHVDMTSFEREVGM